MSNTVKSSRHPVGLWVLFTTELWERFAFYTMRAILVLYLVSISTGGVPGFGWTEADAYKLYGWYTGLVYLSPLLGGWIADRFIGQRMCVIIGAILMALGEFVLAASEFVRIGNVDVNLGADPVAMWTFYAGLGLMILGNGFFKPCISVMVGQLYKPGDDRMRDSGFTIFYMGINIGAFMSPLIGGTVAEIYGYQFGFIIAGCGMICGLISFLMFGKYLKGIGNPPARRGAAETLAPVSATEGSSLFTHGDENAASASNEMTPEEKATHEQALYEQTRPLVKKDYDKMFVIFVLSLFVIAFWIAFEQAGSSLNIFAKNNTNRSVADVAQKVLPEWILLKNEDFVEYQKIVVKVKKLSDQIGHESDEIEHPSFSDRVDRFKMDIQWKTLVPGWMLDLMGAERPQPKEIVPIEEQIAEMKAFAVGLREKLRASKYEIVQEAIVELNQVIAEDDEMIVNGLITKLEVIAEAGKEDAEVVAMVDELKQSARSMTDKALAAEKIREALKKQPVLSRIVDHIADNETEEAKADKAASKIIAEHEERRARILKAITVLVEGEQGKRGGEIQSALLAMDSAERKFDVRYVAGVEPLTFPATWYQSVNAMCVVIFAPLFMIMWGVLARFGIEPSTPTKFALGLLLVSASFWVMIPGAIQAKQTGGQSAFYWLLLCYLLATWGELCLSPVGLSMVTKLSPVRYASQFMGLWFLASSVSYILAGYAASYFGSGEGVELFFGKDGGLADFFVLMALIPAVIGFIALAMAPMLKQKMHGIH
jgi:POT family proton-dependent oligopeptide transporter